MPTHRRASTLKQCLAHIEHQTVADRIEVIVVSDGHDPQTAELFAKIENGELSIAHVQFLAIEKSHQGVARNRGVERARAERVLFIGDDIFLEPNACEAHLKTEGQAAILGFTTWDPAVGITPVMEWLEKSGWQFGYPKISRYAHGFLPTQLQHRFTYTSHISLPTEVAKAHPFREDVSLYGWEDIEWGMRLKDAGVRLFYNPDAKALHHHHMTLEDSLKRMETLGRSVVHLSEIAPMLDRRPTGLKLLLYQIAAMQSTLEGRHRAAFLRGMNHES